MTTLFNSLSSDHNRSGKFAAIMLLILIILVGAILLGSAIFYLLPGTSLINTTPINILGIGSKTPWHLSRASGTVAYLLLTGSTAWGLLLSSKIIKETIPAALSLVMHNVLSWLALAFTGFHAMMMLLDNYYSYKVADLTIPFIGPYRPGWVGLGIISFYMMVVVTLSFYVRKQMGQKRWRSLHYLSFAAYILVTIHAIAAGTDTNKLGMQIVYLGSGLLVFFLINYRLLVGNAKRIR